MEAILSVFANLVPTIGLRRIRSPGLVDESGIAKTRRDRQNKPPARPSPVK